MSRSSITRSALKISTAEGCWAVAHFVLTSGAFFTGFALFLGATDFQLGVLAAICCSRRFQVPGAYPWRRRMAAAAGGLVLRGSQFLAADCAGAVSAGQPFDALVHDPLPASSVVMNRVAGWVAGCRRLCRRRFAGATGMRNRINGGSTSRRRWRRGADRRLLGPGPGAGRLPHAAARCGVRRVDGVPLICGSRTRLSREQRRRWGITCFAAARCELPPHHAVSSLLDVRGEPCRRSSTRTC